MTKKELEKLRKLFKKSCIKTWTSEDIPVLTKTEAERRWIEISVLFETAICELLEGELFIKATNNFMNHKEGNDK